MNSYLPIAEYSSKYKVSISTLRRRIKAEDIHFKFDEGKYFILDEPMSTHYKVGRPSLNKDDRDLMSTPSSPSSVVKERVAFFNHQSEDETKVRPQERKTEDSTLIVANRLLNELKKAYSQILQEKEEQILFLKEELADLKTLVRVLEVDNERLKKSQYR